MSSNLIRQKQTFALKKQRIHRKYGHVNIKKTTYVLKKQRIHRKYGHVFQKKTTYACEKQRHTWKKKRMQWYIQRLRLAGEQTRAIKR